MSCCSVRALDCSSVSIVMSFLFPVLCLFVSGESLVQLCLTPSAVSTVSITASWASSGLQCSSSLSDFLSSFPVSSFPLLLPDFDREYSDIYGLVFAISFATLFLLNKVIFQLFCVYVCCYHSVTSIVC